MKIIRSFSQGFLIIALLHISTTGFSQRGNYTMDFSQAQQFLSDVAGRPVYIKVDYFVEGTPYHPDEYYLATLFLKGGKAYTNVPVKFNLMENLVIYRSPNGEELVAESPIDRVEFTDTANFARMKNKIFERGYKPVNTLNESTFYEVLDSGNISLLKHYRVWYTDKKHYASPSISRVFAESPDYYIRLSDGTMKKLDKGRENLLALIPDKKEKLLSYMNSADLKCKK